MPLVGWWARGQTCGWERWSPWGCKGGWQCAGSASVGVSLDGSAPWGISIKRVLEQMAKTRLEMAAFTRRFPLSSGPESSPPAPAE